MQVTARHSSAGGRRFTLIGSVVCAAVMLIAMLGPTPTARAAAPASVHVTAGASLCAPFHDVRASNKFCASIQWLTSHGVITPARNYHPSSAMTRGTMAEFLYRMSHPGASAPRCSSKPFRDVSVGSSLCGYISWAVKTGVTYGYPDHTYRAQRPVTRQAMAAFLHRVIHPGKAAPACHSAPYRDVPTSSKFCRVIAWMKGAGITTGVGGGRYGADDSVSRQAMAAFLKRSIDKYLGQSAFQARTVAATTLAYEESQQVLDAINRQRRAHGRSALVMDPLLTKACLTHNKAMARANTLSHQLPGEKQFMHRDIAAGASHYKYYGENVGRASFSRDYAGRALAMNTMMYQEKPPNDGHRRNILSAQYSHVGISTYVDPGTRTVWLCQDFGGGHFG